MRLAASVCKETREEPLSLAWARATAPEVTGLSPKAVTVHSHILGGFGRRLEFCFITQAVRIAPQVNGPVKVVWSRQEDVQHDIYRPYYPNCLSADLGAKCERPRGGRPPTVRVLD